MTRRYGLIPLAVVLLFAAGCGGKSRVAGTVTLNGSPVKGGVVTFIGADNQRKAANINADGEYQLDEPPAGAVKVTVTGLPAKLPTQLTPMPGVHGAPSLPQPQAAAQALPRKYANPDNGLTFTVTKGRQKFDIELTP